MGTKDFKYGIFIQNDLMTEMKQGQNQRTALLGQIVKIEATLGGGKYAVRFLKDAETWESTTFVCRQQSIVPVNEKLWQFLYAVTSPQERVKLAKDKERCDKLANITTDITIGFKDTDGVQLGQIKFLGVVRGIGHCVGIKLHQKKKDNKCDGSCAGTQYFNCLPGYGVFTTIDRIVIQNSPLITNKNSVKTRNSTDLDLYLEKNVSSFSKSNHEEIVTKFGEYPQENMPPKTTTYLRNSLSLQNILDTECSSGNSNNDFDQNTIIQPDKSHLINEKKAKMKSEINLSDMIGNSWHGATDAKELQKFSNLNQTLDRPEKNGQKNNRNKSANILSHFYDGTLPKRNKINQPSAKFYDTTPPRIKNGCPTHQEDEKKINEKSEKASNIPDKPKYHNPKPGTTKDLTVGSLVEVSNDVSEEPLYGVVKWMGAEEGSNFVLVGVELEEEHIDLPLTLTDGTHNGERFFKCAENRALFVPLDQCHQDSRFQDGVPTPVHQAAEPNFQSMECPVIEGAVAPLCMPTEEDVEAVCGKFRGIQGHHNSCYLDVTLFSMFTYTAVFDSLLFRPKGPKDIPDYNEVQRVLREEIVNPLRKNLFVRADRVMNLRRLLDRLSSVSGLTSEEKDPEEFLNSLLAQILKAEPFLKLNSGQESFYYQLFVEKDADLTLPTVQQLFEQSFLTSNIKLKEVPSCLIIQMPRFGKNYKMYPRILPSQLLDVTDVIEGSPRQCIVCGKLAHWECRECFDDCSNAGLESTAFCSMCLEKAHRHERRSHHRPAVKLDVCDDFSILEDHCRPPRLFMELFAVICIETSHYVAFVKCGVGHEAPWCFFDSMADRKGEKNGYNIPEMVACPDISRWLSDERICRQLHEDFPQDRHLPEHARRLLCDAYICMYQSSDVMMYR
ncbi:Ubiquitin carboxyl-terminal hydrolase CYLD-like Protein [Tribolium castaneum]|uniref:ubiquitinyl hydrolase 1 n=2 Tax=Tribolium castaneum TaxID=7070 RepID=D6WM17_TRICA|nr:Ubiquitin carboxyl-terminal hydrolase CYLD-like Protein [Tribolium castaneum]